jgi:ribosome-associated protein
MIEFKLKDSLHIDLCDLLKITGLFSTGAEAKHIIATGVVKVDGVVELRKRAKIRSGQIIEYLHHKIQVS